MTIPDHQPEPHPRPVSDALDSTDAGRAALRGGALRTVAYVIGVLLSLISVPLLIRHLGPRDFGRYGTVVAIVAIVTGLTEGGLNAVALREHTVGTGAERRIVMGNLLGIRLTTSVLGVGAAVGFTAIAGYGSELVLGTAVAGVGMVFVVTQTFLIVGLQAQLRYGWVSIVEIARQAVTVVLIVVGVLLGTGVVGFLFVAVPAAGLALLTVAALVRGTVPLRPRFDVRLWWPLLSDAVPYSIAIALNSLYFRLTIVFMSLMASALQTGYFVTSFRITEILIGIPGLVIGAVFPILARTATGDEPRFVGAAARVFELSVVTGAAMVLVVMIGADFAIDVVGGADAAPAGAVLRIQCVAVLANFVAVAGGFPLLALRFHRSLLVANMAALVTMAVLALVLIPPFDARGAAVAGVVAEIVLAALTTVLLMRAAPSLRLPLRSAAVIVAVAVIACLAGLAVPAHPILQALVGLTVYAAGLRLAGRFPPELRELLANRQPAASAS